jgi:hypothetical protein
MKSWRLLITLVMAATLVACYHGQDQADVPVPPVPTSPNAAYQTAFPVLGSTETTILGTETPEAATPEAEQTPTQPAMEEVTTSPETITVEPPDVTPTPGEA